jgi:hypothetical protein
MHKQSGIAVRKPTNKIYNKKLKRRRIGLSAKSYEYGKLDGVELALFIRYPKRGDFYSYISSKQLSWLPDIEKMVKLASSMFYYISKFKQMMHPKARTEFPEDVKTRVEEARRKLKNPGNATLQEEESSPEKKGGLTMANAFPDFPEFNLTTLRKRFQPRS